MLNLILFRLWPVWVPLILYLIWWWWRRWRARRHGHLPPSFFDGPWRWAVYASLGLAAASLLWLGISHPDNTQKHYTPAQFDKGTLTPNRLE